MGSLSSRSARPVVGAQPISNVTQHMQPKPHTVAFLHTSPVHVPTFAALVERIQPGTRAVHFVDEALLHDARVQGHDAPDLVRRVHEAMHAAASSGAPTVVCTCSTIGAAAEATPTHGRFSPKRIDRAMADAAARSGPKVLVVAALRSTLAPTSALVRDSAQRMGLQVEISEHLVPGAWSHFERGDVDAYCAEIESAVRQLLPGPDVVVLAQASMAPAAAMLQGSAVPVLCSPELGVRDALFSSPSAA